MLCSFVEINTDTMTYRNSNMQHNLSLEDLSLCKKKIGKINQLTFGIMSFFKDEFSRLSKCSSATICFLT